ncbi:hypothetical protein H312_00288 [Anncaliia algerae PRA339]|uniref:Uncharacterized protein n=1 Tax=Anncaliia algerae PRA339 TaxID=1288291 RepID=A0A059F4Y4_9MICR|nr:hypothetical protein H312_00288 [Anncaliia algerae PRA339]
MDNLNKKLKFTSTVTDDPFDIFKGRKTPILLMNEKENNSLKIDEDKFINFLKGKEVKITKKTTYTKNKVYKKMRVFSTQPLEIKELVYYKFPFADNIVKENNPYFTLIYDEFIKAFDSVLCNYKNKDYDFFVKINQELIYFGYKISSTIGLKELFKVNDVKFMEEENELIIERNEIFLLVDLLLNLPSDGNFMIPFILSKHEFFYSIIYQVKVKKLPIVQCKDIVNFHYEINNYFIGSDYSELFNYDIKLFD